MDEKINNHQRSPRYVNCLEFLDEDGERSAIEIEMNKQKIKDDKPVHIGVAILQWSKLLFLSFMEYLKEHLESGSYQTCYTDTDSLCLGLTKSMVFDKTESEDAKIKKMFLPIVKPEKMKSFLSTYKDWFVTTDQIEDIRCPGKLKIEFSMLEGHFVALCSKSYIAECQLEQKIATKGIPHSSKLELEVS